MKTLVAGFGNIFRSDDGLGCEVLRALGTADLGESVRLRDFGTSGMHLALEMLSGYDAVVIVDAVGRDEPPGTVFAIDCSEHRAVCERAPDAHDMTMDGVLALFEQLFAQSGAQQRPRIVVVGCVPENLDEGMGLSDTVRATVPACAEAVCRLIHQSFVTGVQT